MVELEALNRVVDQIREKGAELVVISPQLPEHSRKLIEEHELKFELLYDKNLSLSDSLNLSFEFSEELIEVYQWFGADLPAVNNTDDWRLPMPARYIMDENGAILHAEVNADYKVRPEPEEILTLI